MQAEGKHLACAARGTNPNGASEMLPFGLHDVLFYFNF